MADRSIKVKLEAEVSQYTKDLEGAAKTTEKLAVAQELAGKNAEVAAAKQKEAASKIVAAEKSLQSAKDSGKASSQQLSTAERKVAEAKRDHWKATNELKSAELALTKAALAQKEVALQQSSAWGKASAFYKENRADIDAVGTSLTVMGAAGTAGLGAAAKAAISWESAWAGVTKTVNGTDAELASLQAGLRDMAKELPSSHAEIAAVAEAAGALGVATGDVKGFTRTMIDLGETTNLTADEAATQIAQISNVMGTMERDGAKGVERFGSALVALGNDGASTEAEILAMAQRIAGAGKTLNATEADVLAVANTLASMGINAELGGGVTSRVLLKMRSAVDMGGDSLTEFAKVAGLSADDFATKFRTAPMEALDLVAKGIHRVNEAGGNITGTLAEMGVKGTEETQVMLALANSGDLLSKSLTLGADAWETNSALAAEAGKRYETAEAKVAMAWNSIKDAAIDAGAYILPAVVGIAEGAAGIADAFGALPGPVKGVLTGLGGFVSVGALAAGTGIKLAGSISDSYLAVKRLSGESPKASKAVKGLGVAAGVTTAALSAMMIAAAYDGGSTTQGIEEIEDGVKRLALGASALDTVFKKTGEGNGFVGQARELKDLVGYLGDDSTWAGIERGFGQGLSGITSIFGDDLRAKWVEQKADLEAYGDQIAALAESDLPSAVQAFQALNNEAGGTDQTARTLLESMPGLRDALIGVASESELAADDAGVLDLALGRVKTATQEAADAANSARPSLADVAEELGKQAEEADAAHAAMMAYADGVLGLRDAERGFEDALAKANESLEKNKQNLDITTEAGRANQAALDDVAKAGLDVVDSAREQGASQAELEGKMRVARSAFIDTATSMGMSKDAARALANELGLIPKDVESKVTVDTTAALLKVAGIKTEIANIKGKTVTITTNSRTNEVTYRTTKNGPAAQAHGGRAGLPAFSTGGRMPRTGLGTDQILGVGADGVPTAWVDDREWIINRKSSDKYDSLLKMINRDDPRISALAGFASGGRVGVYERKVKSARAELAAAKASKDEKRVRRAEKELDAAKSALADLRATRSGLTVDFRRGGVDASSGYGAADYLWDASKDSNLSTKRRKSLAKDAMAAEKAIGKLQRQAEKAEAKLEKARGHLEEMSNVKASVGSALSGAFSLGDSIKAGTEDSWTQKSDGKGNVWHEKTAGTKASVSGSSLVSNAKAYAGKLKTFGAALKRLADWGLKSVVLQEIAGYGVDDGLLIANSLSKSQVEELNGAYSQIDAYSQQIGTTSVRNFTTADGTNIASLDAANSAVVKSEKSLSSIEKQLDGWETKIEKILGKIYGVKGYSSGGFTGNIPTSAVAGAVHGQEFVAHAKATSAYRPYLEAMNRGTFSPAMSSPIVNVNVDKQIFAGMTMTLLVDGKPMKAVIQGEVKNMVSAGARGY